jgi:hypothetical protein
MLDRPELRDVLSIIFEIIYERLSAKNNNHRQITPELRLLNKYWGLASSCKTILHLVASARRKIIAKRWLEDYHFRSLPNLKDDHIYNYKSGIVVTSQFIRQYIQDEHGYVLLYFSNMRLRGFVVLDIMYKNE